MKLKLFSILLISTLLNFSLTGCFNQKSEDDKNESSSENAETQLPDKGDSESQSPDSGTGGKENTDDDSENKNEDQDEDDDENKNDDFEDIEIDLPPINV